MNVEAVRFSVSLIFAALGICFVVNPLIWLIVLFFSAIHLSLLVAVIVRDSSKSARVPVLSVVIIFAANAFAINETRNAWMEHAEIKWATPTYSTCERTATKLPIASRIVLCSYNTKFEALGFTRAVIYDSTGGIALAPPLQPRVLSAALKGLHIPFGIVGYSITNSVPPYYIVDFQESFSPNTNQ